MDISTAQRNKRGLLQAESCLAAAQAIMTDCYAKGQTFSTITTDTDSSDVDISSTSLAKEFLELADLNEEPYILMLGCGRYSTYCQKDIHKAYTVYFMIYWPDKDSDPWFFDGTEWTHIYPWNAQGKKMYNNWFTINGESIDIQLYYLTSMNQSKWTALHNCK